MNPETPEADAVEQARQEVPEEETPIPPEVPFDADPADLVDQYREIPTDDDFYEHD